MIFDTAATHAEPAAGAQQTVAPDKPAPSAALQEAMNDMNASLMSGALCTYLRELGKQTLCIPHVICGGRHAFVNRRTFCLQGCAAIDLTHDNAEDLKALLDGYLLGLKRDKAAARERDPKYAGGRAFLVDVDTLLSSAEELGLVRKLTSGQSSATSTRLKGMTYADRMRDSPAACNGTADVT